jgi:hypothetical protein
MIEGFRRSSRRRSLLGLAVITACVASAAVATSIARADPPPALFAGGMQGIMFAHGAGHGNPHHGNPQLLYHFGPVLTGGAAVTSIFWGQSWGSNAGDKITGLDSFYGGVGGSKYAGTNTEYTDSNGTHVSSAVSYQGHLFDPSAASSGAPSTSQVLAVVQNKITDPVSNGYYPVYSDQPRGHAGYCAWHSWGTDRGVLVQFAFFFKLDGDAGCDPNDTLGLYSEGLSALANVSGHELSETLTDPTGGGWFDSSGAENADKCAWHFSGFPVSFGGTKWKIQGNWSNDAYTNGTGYLAGTGCIDGH